MQSIQQDSVAVAGGTDDEARRHTTARCQKRSFVGCWDMSKTGNSDDDDELMFAQKRSWADSIRGVSDSHGQRGGGTAPDFIQGGGVDDRDGHGAGAASTDGHEQRPWRCKGPGHSRWRRARRVAARTLRGEMQANTERFQTAAASTSLAVAEAMMTSATCSRCWPKGAASLTVPLTSDMGGDGQGLDSGRTPRVRTRNGDVEAMDDGGGRLRSAVDRRSDAGNGENEAPPAMGGSTPRSRSGDSPERGYKALLNGEGVGLVSGGKHRRSVGVMVQTQTIQPLRRT